MQHAVVLPGLSVIMKRQTIFLLYSCILCAVGVPHRRRRHVTQACTGSLTIRGRQVRTFKCSSSSPDSYIAHNLDARSLPLQYCSTHMSHTHAMHHDYKVFHQCAVNVNDKL